MEKPRRYNERGHTPSSGARRRSQQPVSTFKARSHIESTWRALPDAARTTPRRLHDPAQLETQLASLEYDHAVVRNAAIAVQVDRAAAAMSDKHAAGGPWV